MFQMMLTRRCHLSVDQVLHQQDHGKMFCASECFGMRTTSGSRNLGSSFVDSNGTKHQDGVFFDLDRQVIRSAAIDFE
jgi:hypothetical protein